MRRLSAPRDARWTRFAAQNRGKAMRIEKVLNNNVVVALDENGAETVLMGRGLGFGRRAGDEAPAAQVEKRFTLHSDQRCV